MNILFCTSSNTKSGGSRQALYLAQELTKRGHNLTFFTPADSTLRTLDATITWKDLPKEPNKWRQAIESAFPTNGEPAIFHAFHNKAVKKAAWWGLSWRKRGIRCVGHRGVVFRPGNPLPYWSPGIASFIVNSKACAKVLSQYGVGKNRLHVVYNGIPEERTHPTKTVHTILAELGLSEKKQDVLGTIAGNNPVKGVDILLKAFALAKAPHAHLLMIGGTPEKWNTLAQQLGIADRFHCVGHTESVANYLQVMDAFVLPSRSESMPNTLLEAIRAGLPSIGTKVGGVPELLEGIGALVEPENVEELAHAITTMLTDIPQREIWTQKSREAATRYTIAHRADRVEEIYRPLLQCNTAFTE